MSTEPAIGVLPSLLREGQSEREPMNAEAELAAITNTIVEQFKPVQIILFGSRARGEARPASDVDILVVVPDGEYSAVLAGDLRSAVSGLRPPVDVIVTTPEEIRRRGNSLGPSDPARRAVAQAQAVVEAVEHDLNAHGLPTKRNG